MLSKRFYPVVLGLVSSGIVDVMTLVLFTALMEVS